MKEVKWRKKMTTTSWIRSLMMITFDDQTDQSDHKRWLQSTKIPFPDRFVLLLAEPSQVALRADFDRLIDWAALCSLTSDTRCIGLLNDEVAVVDVGSRSKLSDAFNLDDEITPDR